ncbi:128_t:CDS:2, partial [Rhizophagus irregularis]
LENVESANKSWFEEGKSHLHITYHSIQFDFDLQDGMITEVKDESNKRIYFNVEGQDDLTITNPKKVKLDNNDKSNYF